MSRYYSLDLRSKVMIHLMSGCSKRETAKVFNIGEATLYRWQKLNRAGSLAPKQRQDWPRKVDESKLRAYVAAHPDHTLKEIGQALGLSFQVVANWLQRLNITRKKRQRSIKNVMSSSGLSSEDSFHK